VGDRTTCRALANFIFAYLKYLQVPVRSVLDLGCGMGLWREEVLRRRPSARYVGVEYSAHACRKYGWQRGSVIDYQPAEDFDLVLCHDVIQYLDDDQAEAAMRNLTGITKTALHLEVLTTEDWENNCDREKTDGTVFLRSADWYRKRLKRHFLACGGGLFLARTAPAVLYELECLR
jgi:trans-aconitate methyltransferase